MKGWMVAIVSALWAVYLQALCGIVSWEVIVKMHILSFVFVNI